MPKTASTQRVKMLYSIDEAGEYLGISRSQIYRLINAKTLTRVRIGTAARVPLRDLEAYLASLQATAC